MEGAGAGDDAFNPQYHMPLLVPSTSQTPVKHSRILPETPGDICCRLWMRAIKHMLTIFSSCYNSNKHKFLFP